MVETILVLGVFFLGLILFRLFGPRRPDKRLLRTIAVTERAMRIGDQVEAAIERKDYPKADELMLEMSGPVPDNVEERFLPRELGGTYDPPWHRHERRKPKPARDRSYRIRMR